MQYEDYLASAKRGLAALREQGKADRLNRETLRVDDPNNCPLGQCGLSFGVVREMFGNEWLAQHGFDVPAKAGWSLDDYNMLTKAWREVLT